MKRYLSKITIVMFATIMENLKLVIKPHGLITYFFLEALFFGFAAGLGVVVCLFIFTKMFFLVLRTTKFHALTGLAVLVIPSFKFFVSVFVLHFKQ